VTVYMPGAASRGIRVSGSSGEKPHAQRSFHSHSGMSKAVFLGLFLFSVEEPLK
jgi:hypothetical protein